MGPLSWTPAWPRQPSTGLLDAMTRVPGTVLLRRTSGRGSVPGTYPGQRGRMSAEPPGGASPAVSGDTPGEWVSVAEAARRLGITPRAVRNRVRHHSLQARPKGNSGREVFLPEGTRV